MATATKKKGKTRRMAGLRRRTETLLAKSPAAVSETPGKDVHRLVHELRVQHAELEMQNEELRRVQSDLETAHDRFAQLYDEAPVGYLTLDADSVVREANLTAAGLLGLDRPAVLKKKLSRFVTAQSRDDLRVHLQRVCTTRDRQRCELQMRRAGGATFTGHMESIAVRTDPGQAVQFLVALSDVTRRRKAEAAVRESQAQLAGIIRSAMDAIITVDSRQRIVLFNEAAARMFGWPADRLMGQPLGALIPEHFFPAHAPQVRAFGKTGVTIRQTDALGKIFGRRANGTQFPIEASVSQVETEGKQFFTVILRDITGRLRLEAHQAQLAAIVDSSEDAIISRGLDDSIITWNAAAERLFGYTAAETVGRSFTALVPPGRRKELGEIRRRIEQGELVAHYETAQIARDGRHIPVSIAASPIHGAGGELIGVSTIIRDMTREREAGEALGQSEAALNNFFDESPLGLIRVSAGGRILRANRVQLELLGRAEGDVLGHLIPEFFADPELARDALDGLARKETLRNHRARLLGRQGSIRHVLIDANGLWEHGRLVHSRWFVRDISRRVDLEREILRISEHEQYRLGQELHDDLCQHLTGIHYLAHSLEMDLAPKSKIDARRAAEIARLVREVNTRTRELSHGLAPANLEADGLVGALEAFVARTRQVFRCDCRFHCARPVPVGDPEIRQHLYRIAQEAVNNAIKHGRATRIGISLAARDRRLILGVRDNGAGLPKEPRRTKGMGLRIMQYRAGLISGSLAVRRKPGGGTSVVCSLHLPMAVPTNQKKP